MTSPQTTTDPGNLPVGSIVAYAGDLAVPAKLQAIIQQGWRLCDGAAYDKTEFAQLYAAIGNANGSSGATFNVPDLRSRFMRGTLGQAAGVDPDAGSRQAAAPNGATGNNTGSVQQGATALPSTSA